MRILRAADYRSMPWKNGGGVTTEIAVSPAGAGLDDFDWRISMARVEAGGPFSVFAGIDRTLSILEGEGMRLTIAGRAPVELTRASDPLFFPADAATDASLPAGPITDLNVMTRRGRARHGVRRLVLAKPFDFVSEAATTLLFCHQGSIAIGESSPVALDAHDTLWLDGASETLRLVPQPHAILFVIAIQND
ncbi:MULTISPECIES: HutD family protein [Phyllobacteriaceae]|mgnify:CR=1 FL=1|jgi:environmental stress-induced protein Ves|uniref:HutD-family protein n=1 Tax=Mesorhizobium hungaricum TaxID=1566387 RepID=A0A1C2DSD4_9HYPH|nr:MULTISPECIES: HutD family protein [Mesorhizobium]MBN9235926.1 HutD family protein [Mesorhizobium sp.]OCX17692.1 HutD-family protein [Mesorhizobium hungaricum]